MRVGLLSEYRLQNGLDDYLRVDTAYVNEGLRSQASRVNDVVDTQIADPHIPIDRYNIIGMMRQHIDDNLVAYGDAISVSDSLYLREMNIWTLSKGFGNGYNTMRDAPSHFGLHRQLRERLRAVRRNVEPGPDSAAAIRAADAAGVSPERAA